MSKGTYITCPFTRPFPVPEISTLDVPAAYSHRTLSRRFHTGLCERDECARCWEGVTGEPMSCAILLYRASPRLIVAQRLCQQSASRVIWASLADAQTSLREMRHLY